MKLILFWIGSGVLAGLFGAFSDWSLYRVKFDKRYFMIPILLGPITWYYVFKSIWEYKK